MAILLPIIKNKCECCFYYADPCDCHWINRTALLASCMECYCCIYPINSKYLWHFVLSGRDKRHPLNTFRAYWFTLAAAVGFSKSMYLPLENVKEIMYYDGPEKFSRQKMNDLFDARVPDLIQEKPMFEILLKDPQVYELMYGLKDRPAASCWMWMNQNGFTRKYWIGWTKNKRKIP